MLYGHQQQSSYHWHTMNRAQLNTYLADDPSNAQLLLEAADAAFAEGDLADAESLIARLAEVAPLQPEARNLAGLVAIGRHQFEEAVTYLRPIAEDQPQEYGARFNLAWALAMLARFNEVTDLLDENVLATVPRAVALRVQALHHLARIDEALELGDRFGSRVNDAALMDALAIVALDANRLDLAKIYAEHAGDTAQGRVARGMIAFEAGDVATAATLFDDAIAADANSGRAWVGRGMALLQQGRQSEALPALDRAAELFGTHIGSWLASGWVRFAASDFAGARQNFERALEIDPSFGETQGALAVLAIIDGNLTEAAERLERARRLDGDAFSRQLAEYLLAQAQGDNQKSDRIFRAALGMRVGVNGQTLAQAMRRLANRGL